MSYYKPTHFVIPATGEDFAEVRALPSMEHDEPGVTEWVDCCGKVLFSTRQGDGSLVVELLGAFMVTTDATINGVSLSGRGNSVRNAFNNLYEKVPYTHQRELAKAATKWLYAVSPNFANQGASKMKMARLCKITKEPTFA